MTRTALVWQRLVSEGYFTSREEAERWIMAGKVRAGGRPVTYAGQKVAKDEPLSVRGLHQKYLSKGGLKLEGALRDFSLSVKDRVCIDAGASTGGFTDCLVRHGASLVYAVDVGYGQLAGSLRNDPRVINMERTNISDEALLRLQPVPTLGTADLSYLSLRKAVPYYAGIMRNAGDLLCLVKPLFEIDDNEARRTGIIAPDAYVPLLHGLLQSFSCGGVSVRGLTHSPITGNHGTLEFFLWLSFNATIQSTPPPTLSEIEAIVTAAKALPLYQKE